MYEELSYNLILQRMLGRVWEANPNLDTREGSIIFDALAPAAIELKQMYMQLDVILDETFADTASREMLIKRVAERGIVPKGATKAILQGEFNMDVPIGARFSLKDLNYIVTEKMSLGVFTLECETFGTVGNYYLGTLIPIAYIDGLEIATLTQVLIPGEDDEETEHLRGRYFKTLDAEAYGGNVADYMEKTNGLSGVGGVKVTPIWNGGGTVKLVIINSDYQAPSAQLISGVQTAFDPFANQGNGIGLAPIGHVVTVEGVQNTAIDITATLVYQSGWVWEDIRVSVERAMDGYFLELSATWESQENLIVRISQIEIRLLDIAGVVDISATTINGAEQNFTLGVNHIPVRGAIGG